MDWLRQLAANAPAKDRLGTARLIDQRARERARDAIALALPVSLGRPVMATLGRDGRPDFSIETYSAPLPGTPLAFGFDRVESEAHGLANTHVDAANHVLVDGTGYAGWAADDPAAPSVADLAGAGLFARGVHVDLPALLGVDWVPIDEPVTGADLDRAVGATFEPGDALLVEVGRDRFVAAGGDLLDLERGLGGLGPSAARWIADRGVSIVCWDFADSRKPSDPPLPVHSLIWALGLVIVDNCTFAGLAGAARHTGALVVAPPATAGGTGALVNPILVL
ncbi:cyclase family protein [Asanoa iriomotensis]|uniref:Cyclase family protein n=1 Tax=Asanoa iriomotensis TaxID=234613 RepID=A0ABQ4C395_9ACTN|nr:cyclase family protein [Asanoa iriomotensis]GIF56755.1 hypothetical protein Air01nite_28500 [Asanoa iriomotensis]